MKTIKLDDQLKDAITSKDTFIQAKLAYKAISQDDDDYADAALLATMSDQHFQEGYNEDENPADRPSQAYWNASWFVNCSMEYCYALAQRGQLTGAMVKCYISSLLRIVRASIAAGGMPYAGKDHAEVLELLSVTAKARSQTISDEDRGYMPAQDDFGILFGMTFSELVRRRAEDELDAEGFHNIVDMLFFVCYLRDQ